MGLTADGKYVTKPMKILEDETVVKIASGGDHLVCLTIQGEVYTLGRHVYELEFHKDCSEFVLHLDLFGLKDKLFQRLLNINFKT